MLRFDDGRAGRNGRIGDLRLLELDQNRIGLPYRQARINPNALKLMLPKSANQLKDKAITTVSIQQAGSGYNYYVELEKVSGIDGVEQALRVRLDGKEDPTVSLHCDKTVAVDEVVKVMNIAKDRNYKLILATQP